MSDQHDLHLRRLMFTLTAAVLAVRSPGGTIDAADAFYDAVAAVDHDADASDRGHLILNAVMDEIEGAQRPIAYDSVLLLSEALAVRTLQGSNYADLASQWTRRSHWAPRTTAIRYNAKLADFDRDLVDTHLLETMCDDLDHTTAPDEALLAGHLTRAVAKLRRTDAGVELIKRLAAGGHISRIVAAGAFAINLAAAPPTSSMSITGTLDPLPVDAEPPPRSLFWAFLALKHDSDPRVAAKAEEYQRDIYQSWPDVGVRLVELAASMADPVSAPPRSDTGGAPVADAATVQGALDHLADATGRRWTTDDLADITAYRLARALGRRSQDRIVDFALRFPERFNARHGVLTWDPELIEQDIAAEASGEGPFSVVDAPRLFISYRWATDSSHVGLADFVAGHLAGLGYDIVFDRDPRIVDKSFSAGEILLLMSGCTHFVPLITDALAVHLADPTATSAMRAEWDLALSLPRLRWLGLRLSGTAVPSPLTPDRILAWGSWPEIDRHLPKCVFTVTTIGHDGIRSERPPVRRHELHQAVAQARRHPDAASIDIRDVTDRTATLLD